MSSPPSSISFFFLTCMKTHRLIAFLICSLQIEANTIWDHARNSMTKKTTTTKINKKWKFKEKKNIINDFNHFKMIHGLFLSFGTNDTCMIFAITFENGQRNLNFFFFLLILLLASSFSKLMNYYIRKNVTNAQIIIFFFLNCTFLFHSSTHTDRSFYLFRTMLFDIHKISDF